MENGQNDEGFSWDLSMDDQNEDPKSAQDIMVRRMKNRERQRRYRARKRLESEGLPVPEEINRFIGRKKKETDIVQFTPPPVEVPVNGYSPANFVAKVPSRRDWKRDARRAHMVKEQNNRDSANKALLLSFGAKDQPSESGGQSTSGPKLDNNQEGAASHGRRNWKEEARNKK